MKNILNQLFEHQTLSEDKARETLVNLANGAYNHSQMAAFLAVFMMRSIRTGELAGFRQAMLDLCSDVDLTEYDAMDMCGTGGDGKDTFNISTLSSFVVAGAGQNVAKHGNNGVSSLCGSSNLLAHFGYEFTNDVDRLKADMERSGICFLHAPLFHPAMKNVAPVRKELGVKTFFNMLGPMVNPSRPKRQMIGVYSLQLARLYQYIYQRDSGQFVIVHSFDGYDEISLTGPFKMLTRDSERTIEPADIGLSVNQPEALFGGDSVKAAADIFYKVLNGKGTKAQTEVVLANAGLALYSAQDLGSMVEGVEMARESLESGKALKSFKAFLNDDKLIFSTAG